MDDQEPELEPCPLCGSKPLLCMLGYDYVVLCQNEFCPKPSHDRQEAIDWWNQHASRK